ncbi:hypothetical protein GUJ93_ZPchr0009g812 [Zizania palustris]|uniref:Uncharacterized protein n=1 Tax=Zizania palustris TaxID=103762 RepID=A0A8J5UZB9_ZIZPA|nr:hypothetical protein GUJ93_ZPchr0009g812 [Zizania palustris]
MDGLLQRCQHEQVGLSSSLLRQFRSVRRNYANNDATDPAAKPAKGGGGAVEAEAAKRARVCPSLDPPAVRARDSSSETG